MRKRVLTSFMSQSITRAFTCWGNWEAQEAALLRCWRLSGPQGPCSLSLVTVGWEGEGGRSKKASLLCWWRNLPLKLWCKSIKCPIFSGVETKDQADETESLFSLELQPFTPLYLKGIQLTNVSTVSFTVAVTDMDWIISLQNDTLKS